MRKIYSSGLERRKLKIKAKIKNSGGKPRLCVFRSLRFIYAQIIDDRQKKTLVAASEKELKQEPGVKLTKSQKARLIGELLGQKAKNKKITDVVFDRNGYKYHGRVKALAQGARAAGLEF